LEQRRDLQTEVAVVVRVVLLLQVIFAQLQLLAVLVV